MTKDYAALQAALQTTEYDTEVRAKSLQPLLTKLNSEEVGETVTQSVPVGEVRSAIGNGVRGLSAVQVQTLRLMVPDTGEVDFGDANIRNEIREVLKGKSAALARLTTLATRTRTHGEAFGFELVTKRDLWRVLPEIAKSYMAVYRSRG